ncbi:M42 family metallopeptidase [Mycoplasmatota bacterium]|nr:M42 family metallopeptidase [Mycoplasmatota bacterium]
MEKLLEKLVKTPGLSGHEEKVIRIMKDELSKYSDNVYIDNLGNVISKIEGTNPEKKVMIFAHMDQLGLVVRKITDDGFIGVERVGGVPEKVLPATEVIVENEDGEVFYGVVANKSHHLTPQSEKYVVTPYLEQFVDIGATTKEEVLEKGIDVGAPITYKPVFKEIMNDKIMGTSLDNRVGCSLLVELSKEFSQNRPEVTVYLVATVLEEFNLRGAMVAARAIKPDIAVCLDVVASGDTPNLRSRSDLSLGSGPVISMYNFHGRGTLNGTIPHPKLVKHFVKVASDNNIKTQKGALTGLLTDLSYVQLENEGIASIDLCYPTRYTHTPTEVVSMSDIFALKDLVVKAINQINEITLSRI